MAWDSSREVPWRRLVREWLLYVAIMAVVLVVVVDGDDRIGAVAGLLVSGPLYLAFLLFVARFYILPLVIGYDVPGFGAMPLEGLLLSVRAEIGL